MIAKACRQCGELKPIEQQFRKYYGGRKGYYNTCKLCEKINARAKYLKKKVSLSETEQAELDKILQLYEAQRQAGLQPPKDDAERSKPLVDSLDDMIEKLQPKSQQLEETLEQKYIPAELQEWLSATLTEEPDYYLDEIYEDLKLKYKPIVSIDQGTMQPVYDTTYACILDKILDKFNKYEDSYWEKED